MSGFTLIEIMVSVSIFLMIMVMSSGAILGVFESNRKSQTLRSVMDNLNLTMETMTRNIRFGSTYHCNASNFDGIEDEPLQTADCTSNSIVFIDSSGQYTGYQFYSSGGTKTMRSRSWSIGTNPPSYRSIISSDVTIDKASFWVYGSNSYASGDRKQPKVVIAIDGYVGSKPTTKSSFHLETTVSQRKFDF